jgi:hypothetical protein
MDERGCMAVADARQKATLPGTYSDRALELYESACRDRIAEGCLKAVELLDRVPRGMDPRSEESKRWTKRRRELLGSACIMMPRSTLAREWEAARAKHRETGKHPTVGACRKLALSWLWADETRSRSAFELACIGHSKPDACNTEMAELRLMGEALAKTCNPDSHGSRTREALDACELLSDLVDPHRARWLREQVCRGRGHDVSNGACEGSAQHVAALRLPLDPLPAVLVPPPVPTPAVTANNGER